jgi:hypothetical protein
MDQRIRPRPSPAQRSMAAAEDVIYISMCSGSVMIKISADDYSQFILGQLIIFGVAMVVMLVELAIWLAN